ncbi:transmembrane emp24 domain-containing protein p24delta9-like isoform X1 [Canna indica]|uniref:Transmembrane emp24 domain-containing protein p24delta9-like isoform X1 n=1 Tax=Canna indica TaxID=4628 RepID=A0AAQ3JP59_9LILI|nr:transmembrane emp24 domain-containing protein p24delta9-like isoform X1 [Canna indica]
MEAQTSRGRRWTGYFPAYALTLALASLLLPAVPSARALRFELQSGHTKCISEDIKLHAMAVGKYTIVNPSESTPLPESHKITVRVTSPYGNSIHYGDQVDSGNFAFTANEEGDYLACLWAPDHKPPATMVVEFEWRTGVAAKDWTNVAKKGQIEGMELELKKLEDTIRSIHDEMFYLREREEQMQDMNRSTNSRMAWLSFLSLAVCLSVAGLQLWHLKTFFERKKLL